VDIVASVIAVLLLVGIVILIRRQMKKEAARPERPRPTGADASSRFHAVSIRYAADACNAAIAMEGRRFLSSAAPKLPLPDCDAAECKCRFRHHDDRRGGKDRRHTWTQGMGGSATGPYLKEQRTGKDRRQND
jgi:hypothetical protein